MSHTEEIIKEFNDYFIRVYECTICDDWYSTRKFDAVRHLKKVHEIESK